jgi:repressor LexA
MVVVPIIGRVAAGVPLLAEENIEGHVSVDPLFVSSRDRVFALRVVGDSMVERGIHDGDLIVVRQQESEPRQGEVVVALVDGQATVKHFFREGERVRLQPANAAMQPIYLADSDQREAAVQGVVVAVMRKMG